MGGSLLRELKLYRIVFWSGHYGSGSMKKKEIEIYAFSIQHAKRLFFQKYRCQIVSIREFEI